MRNRTSFLISAVMISQFMVVGSGCQAKSPGNAQTPSDIPATSTSGVFIQPTQARHDFPSTPTPVLALVDLLSDPLPVAQVDNPTPLPDPLRFSFPTLAPPPVSAWRPPLYPTPWVPTPIDHFYFTRPIAADEINWPLADYRYGGVFIPGVVHTGIDIPAPPKTPVIATGSGRVSFTGYGLYGGGKDPDDPYGLAVVIKHDFGHLGDTLFTVYGHLSRIDVIEGQQVQSGDQLGLVGQTGKTTGPHLHFEVRLGRNNFFRSRNPELWLAPPQGWGILAARVMSTHGALLEAQLVKVLTKDMSHSWSVKTYSRGAAISDASYRENMVLGDLPAGTYEVRIAYAGSIYNLDLEIKPGMVSYFSFRGKNGFKTELPAAVGSEFTPPVEILNSIP